MTNKYLLGKKIMSLYEPEVKKLKVKEIRDRYKAVREEKARRRKEKREKYRDIYKKTLAEESDKLRKGRVIEKAKHKAIRKVKPYKPIFESKPIYRKILKRKTVKHRVVKHKKTKRKTVKHKGKTYYCRKCHKRHSYTSKIGRKHRK